MPCKDTIILTVYDRPELTLLNTFVSLKKQDLTDTEILVIDDGSTVDYTDTRDILSDWELPIRWERISTVEDRPDTYHIDGHNNPAYVNNKAVELAEGSNLFFLSSDTTIPPNTLGSARLWDLNTTVYSTRVFDLDTGSEWNGESRIYPMCWFLGVGKELFNKVSGFDEEYLKGMAFEDSDFVGRCALATGKLVIDCGTLALHQSHPMTAYSDKGLGYKWSEAYTKMKWGGATPWDTPNHPLNYTTSRAGDKLIVKPRPSAETLKLLRAA